MTTAWIPVAQILPDDDETVLVALADGEVWLGYHDGDSGWRSVSSDLIVVTHWAAIPEGPA